MSALVLAAALSLPTFLLPPPSQAPLAEIRGLGSGVANLGDVDGDGFADLQAGDHLHGVSGRTLKTMFRYPHFALPAGYSLAELALGAGDLDRDGFGEVLVSGILYSGTELLTRDPLRSGFPLPFGYLSCPNTCVQGGFANLGDVDGDGIADLAGGWPDSLVRRCPSDHPAFTSGGSAGMTLVYSGKDTTVLHALPGSSPGNAYGGVVARLGDLDGDGLADLGIATRIVPQDATPFCSFSGGNYMRAVSSASGGPLWEISRAPRTLSAIDDLDGDRTTDVALGFPYSGLVELRSGRTGLLLRVLDGAVLLGPGAHLFGYHVFAWPDGDGDGIGDLLVSAPQPLIFPIGIPGNPITTGPGQVLILSSRSGRLLAVLSGAVDGQEFGAAVARLDDASGDGNPELAVGSPRAEGGLVQVFSPRALAPASPRAR